MSQQVYLGRKKLQGYATLGSVMSFSFYKNLLYQQTFNYPAEYGGNDLSFRMLYGLGLRYRLTQQLGVDISAIRKVWLFSLSENYYTAGNSFGIQTKVSYHF